MRKRKLIILVACAFLVIAAGCSSLTLKAATPAGELKPRLVVLTDISPDRVEPDDMESMIRLLVHADLFEIEALVATAGWSNSSGHD